MQAFWDALGVMGAVLLPLAIAYAAGRGKD